MNVLFSPPEVAVSVGETASVAVVVVGAQDLEWVELEVAWDEDLRMAWELWAGDEPADSFQTSGGDDGLTSKTHKSRRVLLLAHEPVTDVGRARRESSYVSASGRRIRPWQCGHVTSPPNWSAEMPNG